MLCKPNCLLNIGGYIGAMNMQCFARVMTRVSLLVLIISSVANKTAAQESGWSEPEKVTAASGPASTPTIAVARDGTLHILWGQAEDIESRPRTIYYMRWSQGNWSEPRDVIAMPLEGGVIEVSSAVVDGRGTLHLGFIDQGVQTGYYTSVPLALAESARAWAKPTIVDAPMYAPFDLVLDRDGCTLYMVYIRFGSDGGVFIRRSTDGGNSWSRSFAIAYGASERVGPGGQSVTLDAEGNLHVVWFDTFLGKGYRGAAIRYSRSTDAGETWSEPVTLDQRDARYSESYGPNWPAIAAVGERKLVVVWDGAPSGQRHYNWSSDNGLSWSDDTPTGWTLRGITDRQGLAVDSSGTVHWVTGANKHAYYAYWAADATRWSDPVAIDRTEYSPHRPTLVVANGNRLAVVWNDQKGDLVENWFATRVVSAPPSPTQWSSGCGFTSEATLTTQNSQLPNTTQPIREVTPTVPTTTRMGRGGVPDHPFTADPLIVALGVVSVFLVVVAAFHTRHRKI